MTTPPKRPNWNRWTPDPHDPFQVLQRIEKDKKNQRDRERKNKKKEWGKPKGIEPSSSSVEDQVRELDAASSSSAPASASASTTESPPVVYLGTVSDDVFKVVDKTPTYEGNSMLVFSVSAYQKHLWDFGKRWSRLTSRYRKTSVRRKSRLSWRQKTSWDRLALPYWWSDAATVYNRSQGGWNSSFRYLVTYVATYKEEKHCDQAYGIC